MSTGNASSAVTMPPRAGRAVAPGSGGSGWPDAVSWTPPTSTELGVVAKSGLAAGLAWSIAVLVTDVPARCSPR